MIREGTDKGKYTLTEDNTIKDLKNFKQLFKRNCKGYDKLDDMLPTLTSQPEYMLLLNHINFHLLIV